MLQIQPLWKGETALIDLVKQFFPDACREYSSPWLKGQRIDVFVPSVKVGFEYQGEQHFKPIEFFGGTDAFVKMKARDERKRKACEAAGVVLIEWNFNEPVNTLNLILKLKAFGIDVPYKS